MPGAPLLELRGVAQHFGARPPYVRAVDGVDLRVAAGEVVGLVGESGCGKSTLARMAAGIVAPSAGQVLFEGRDIATLPADAARAARLRVQMVFQNPYASLNPRHRVARCVGEAPFVHGMAPRAGLAEYVTAQLLRTGLGAEFARRYPHQMSGGQRQRVAIARALAVGPDLLVCDEAVAALDVSVQAQILNLFMDLRAELGLAYLFISHDLGVVEHLCDRVAIMYLGRIVEQGGVEDLFGRANHPYTQALLAGIPRIAARRRAFTAIAGELPSPLHPPSGCHFHPRCPHAMPVCRAVAPALREIAPGHRSACHLNDRQ